MILDPTSHLQTIWRFFFNGLIFVRLDMVIQYSYLVNLMGKLQYILYFKKKIKFLINATYGRI